MNKNLSRELPYFNDGCYVGLEKFVEHIQELASSEKTIRFIMSNYYTSSIYKPTKAIESYRYNCDSSVMIEFYKDDILLCEFIIPKGKIYKINPNGNYLEILEGFDYSNDKNFGDEVRVN